MSEEHSNEAEPVTVVLLVGTANAHKLQELSQLLDESCREADFSLRVLGTDSLPPGPPVVENGETFRDNACIKAIEFAKRASALPRRERPEWVIADDSGLCVEALDGAPGVYSARYAGEGASHADNNAKLLEALREIRPESRGAEFVCIIACAPVPDSPTDPVEIRFTVEGHCRGTITETLHGEGGFGYDPLFFVPAEGKTFAEVPPQRKGALSHRGQALRAFVARWLREMEDPHRPWYDTPREHE